MHGLIFRYGECLISPGSLADESSSSCLTVHGGGDSVGFSGRTA